MDTTKHLNCYVIQLKRTTRAYELTNPTICDVANNADLWKGEKK